MSWYEFWIIFGVCATAMLLCRVVPLFVMQGRDLPHPLLRALGFIPPAAFAALVANDLFSPDMFSDGIWTGAIPLVTAVVCALIGVKTRSLIACVIGGVVVYALLTIIV